VDPSRTLPSQRLLINFISTPPTRTQVKYCDGGFYSGDVKHPVAYKNSTLYFRGRHIHPALVDSLMEMYVCRIYVG
jgi:hypothetical protein